MTDEELLRCLADKTTAYVEASESLIAEIKRQLASRPEESFPPSHLDKLDRIRSSLQELKAYPQIYRGKMEFDTDIDIYKIIVDYVQAANYGNNSRSRNRRKQRKAGSYVKNAVQIKFSTLYDEEEHADTPIYVFEKCLPIFKIVVEQLIDNAIKYTPNSLRETDPIEIRFEYSKRCRYKFFSLTNWGPLVEEDETDEIFNPEIRGRNAEAIQHAGLGIGLFLAQEIAELHHTQIEVKVDDSTIRTIDGIPHAKITFNLMMVYDIEGNIEGTNYALGRKHFLFPKIFIHEIKRNLGQIFTWSKSSYDEFYHQQKGLYSAFICSEVVPPICRLAHANLDLYGFVFLISWLMYRNNKALSRNEDYKNFRIVEDGLQKYAFGLRPEVTVEIDMQASSLVSSWQPVLNEIFCYRLLRYAAARRNDPDDPLSILYDRESVVVEADFGFDFGPSPLHPEIKELHDLPVNSLEEYEVDFLAEIAKMNACLLSITNRIILWNQI